VRTDSNAINAESNRFLPDAAAFRSPFRLSVAAPAYNEAEGIGLVVESWRRYLAASAKVEKFEIIVCNDGSGDATGNILDQLARLHGEVRPIHFMRNQGAAAALTTAIAATTQDWVLLTDSDGQFPIENLKPMWAAICQQGAPAAIGIRQKKDHLFARFGTSASGLLCNCFHRSSIRDFNSAFKLVWGPLLRALNLEAKGMNYSTEVTSRLLECGVTIAEVEIDHRPRTTGSSSMRLLRGAAHRASFVSYVGMRQLLFGIGVLRRPLS
jgi:dolichol-phosphate mannosyltransferase